MRQSIGHITQSIRRLAFGSMAVLLLAGLSPALYGMRYAAAAENDCHPVTPASAGVTTPTGSDAVTYTYDACTGLWQNQYYTYNPATGKTTPKAWWSQQIFTYDAVTGKWQGQKWAYRPADKSWYQHNILVTTPPDGAPLSGGPAPAQPAAPVTDDQSATGDPSTLSAPSSGGTSSAKDSSSTDTTLNNSNSVSMDNNLNSTAASGNATVAGNTFGGSATSGDSQAMANVVNMLQSSSSLAGAATFVANINGDVQGDLLIDPDTLQPASTASALATTTNNLTVHSTTDAAINNNITLAATSGDATVKDNTHGGDATSGNAQAVANVVNLLNSMISAKQSFVGVININGNLKGDILVPQKFLDSLLASNAPRRTLAVSSDTINKLNANISNNQAITNNVTSTAVSGSAAVKGNTHGGDATTGSATTNVTIFDLTSNHIMASNTLLVFVNVLGSWVGVIMNAPAGTTAAALGGGVQALGATAVKNTIDINSDTNQAITNNINVAAQSGDALVKDNTHGGNATSGDASTAVNLLNITSSDFSLTGWFGILFINVFGNWYGNFGVAPPPVVTIPQSGTTATMPTSSHTFSFIPHASSLGGSGSDKSRATSLSSVIGNDAQNFSPALASSLQHVLGSTVAKASQLKQQQNDQAVQHGQRQALLIGGGLVALGLVIILAEAWQRRQSHRA